MIDEYEGSAQIDPELKPTYFLAANDDDDTEPVGSTSCPDDDDDDDDDGHGGHGGGSGGSGGSGGGPDKKNDTSDGNTH
jgi:hypothetical protein